MQDAELKAFYKKTQNGKLKRNALFLFASVAVLVIALAFSNNYIETGLRQIYPTKYSELVEKYAELNKLPEPLIYAVIKCESGFKPYAASNLDAIGLMQIREITFDWLKTKMSSDESGVVFDDLYDPETNIRYGTFLLRLLKEEFGETVNVLCAYHAGWGNAKNWLADERYSPGGVNISTIPFGDTKAYVDKVLKTNDIYIKLYY
ncbi:MAG: lytic transglycosylase domain-containing protein [Oscillospiraceae bacterium]|nr:lytic transglycosylase domain-containing protein [Oscillospiraceae bacterium]